MFKKFFSNRLIKNAPDFDKRVEEHKKEIFSEIRGGSVVFEIGAGTGVNLKYFPKDISYIAIEPNELLIPHLQEEISKQGISGKASIFSSRDAFPGDASVDFVVSTFVLCSVEDQAKTLAQILRVLKPGGRFLYLEHVRSRNLLYSLLQTIVRPFSKMLFGGCDPSRDTSFYISKAGFRILKEKNLWFGGGLWENPNILGVAEKI